ncbi:hypothetical protein SAMN04487941_2081 [Pontibacter akesuensis]|uniref:Uncharacterized protein n=1 Tax=Pontibacter akesuensis TaxID=388950 RepID=A0A1I7IC71_9BACT|nr:hypothetical protein GCM10007389_19140 [Pontibacter akesuensis]SFU70436.1 hypothetical protein SAMN04487941_2081 [Pontibacter akesuensis]
MLTKEAPYTPREKSRKKAKPNKLNLYSHSDPNLKERAFRRRIEWGAIAISVFLFSLLFGIFIA